MEQEMLLQTIAKILDEKKALDIHIQREEIFEAMHRI